MFPNNDKMKVLIVLTGSSSDAYYPDAGGIQLAEYSFCESAIEFGLKPGVLVRHNKKYNEKPSRFKARVNFLKVKSGNLKGLSSYASFSLKASAEILEQSLEGLDIVHFTNLMPAMFMMNNRFIKYMRKGGSINTKFVYTIHNYHYSVAGKPEDIFLQYSEEWEFLKNNEIELINNSDMVFVTSKRLSETLTKKYGRETIYLPNTIGRRSNYLVKEMNTDKYDVLLTMSRLAKGKNLKNLIKGFEMASKANSKLRLIITDSGELKSELISLAKGFEINYTDYSQKQRLNVTKKLVEDLNKFQIIFAGRVIGKLKNFLYNFCDCVILLSEREISPLVGLESLVYGKHFIGGNCPGWLDYSDFGSSVNIIKEHTPKAISEEIAVSMDKVKRNRGEIRKKKLQCL
jgi:glycosyltransferase involved in cell wall biosynthesis